MMHAAKTLTYPVINYTDFHFSYTNPTNTNPTTLQAGRQTNRRHVELNRLKNVH